MADARASAEILVALGGNMPSPAGAPEKTLRAAFAALGKAPGVALVATSALYATPCFPAGAGPDYVNAACKLESALGPDEILAALHRIEADYGRARTRRWGQRTLDLDLIAHGQHVLPDPVQHAEWRSLPLAAQTQTAPDRLILPHPRLAERAFVLVPLNDVAPAWRHPILGRSVSEMLADLPGSLRDEVTALA